MRVLGTPVREHDYGVNPALECSDIGGDPLEVRAIQRSGTWWHVQPIGAWPGAGGGRVSPMESTAMKPTRTPSRSMITGRRAAAKFRPAPTVWIWPESKRARVCRSAIAVVSDVVVGQGQQIEPGRPQRRSDARAGRK